MKFWQLTVFGLLAFAMVARAEDDAAAAAAEPSAEPEAEPEAEPASAEPEPEVEPTAEAPPQTNDEVEEDTETETEEEPATKGEASPNTKDPDNGCGAFQLSAALMVPALMALMAH